ncbi:MAG: class I SAM-dependent methyltransferase [Thermoleophilia bacterium]
MKFEEYEIMRHQEDDYWWHRGMRSIILEQLVPTIKPDSRLLDIGCGTGANLQLLSDYCETTGIDIHEEAVRYSRERGLDNIFLGDGKQLPFEDEAFTHAVCCAVLQNIPDDQAAMGEAYRILAPGGYYLITEQTYPILWGRHDISQGAIRRYSKKDLQAKVERAGFRIESVSFAIKSVLPLVMASRLVRNLLQPPKKIDPESVRSDLTALPAPINNALYKIFEKERRNRFFGKLPVGLTIIVLARKPMG